MPIDVGVRMAIIQTHLHLFRCSITFFSFIIFNFVISFFHAALQDSDNYTLLVRHTINLSKLKIVLIFCMLR
jgi:hypothetical protein